MSATAVKENTTTEATVEETAPAPKPKRAYHRASASGSGMAITGVITENSSVIGFMTPEAMDGLLFISTFEQADPESPAPDKHGYQREPLNERIPKIARFYMDGDNADRIPPLTLSVRLKKDADISKFVKLFNKGDKQGIKDEFGDKVISIVDGQHRFLGLVRAHDLNDSFSPRVPVMINFGLSFAEEAKLFDTINSTQRKLPRALIEATKTDVTELGEVTHAQRIRTITMRLARDKDSPWYNKVNLTGARNPDKPITFEGLRRSTVSMFPKELLERIDAAEYDAEFIAMDYWKLVADACPAAWNGDARVEEVDGEETLVQVSYRLKELVGVAAVSKLGQNIISSALEHEKFDQRLGSLTGRLSEVDWEKSKTNPWMSRSQAGFAGQPELYSMLYGWVYSGKRPDSA